MITNVTLHMQNRDFHTWHTAASSHYYVIIRHGNA